MNIVYIAPMFHTNQVPIVKGWVEHGDQVCFICQYRGKTENHDYCTPIVLGYSRLFLLINAVYKKICGRKKRLSAYPEAFQDKCGFPPIFKLAKILKKQKPDLVVLRERSVYCIFACMVCRIHRIKCILYNQTPLWDDKPPRNDLAHRIVKRLTPSTRMTPVLGDSATGYLDSDAVYVPFVIEPHLAPAQKKFYADGTIRLLCVGKFEERKHHLMLLEILTHLLPEYPISLTLVGEASTPHHESYLKKVREYINVHHLEAQVHIHTNCKPDQMADFYRNADLFVLPSTGEFASVSQLEAMSYSLPVIVSDTNGTACYVENSKNGYLFRDKDIADLEAKITNMLRDLDRLKQMGARSYELVQTKYAFSNYMDKLKQMSQEK